MRFQFHEVHNNSVDHDLCREQSQTNFPLSSLTVKRSNQFCCGDSSSELSHMGTRTEIARGRRTPHSLALCDRPLLCFISAGESALHSDPFLEAAGTISSSSLQSFGFEGEYKRSIGIASVADIVDIVSCSLTASVSRLLDAMHVVHCAYIPLTASSDTCDCATHARFYFGSSVKDVVV